MPFVGIRMVLFGKISERFLDFVFVGFGGHSQHFIVVFLGVEFADREGEGGNSSACKKHS